MVDFIQQLAPHAPPGIRAILNNVHIKWVSNALHVMFWAVFFPLHMSYPGLL